MPTPLISPNLHVILIHYPLAMLMAGTLIELFSFLWKRSSFRIAGRWMILIGGLSTLPATFAGIYALRDVARVDADMRWTDLKAESPVLNQPELWAILHNHVLYQSIVTGIMALLIVVWLGCSDRLRNSLHLVFMLILLFAVSIMIKAAWLGGEAIYRHGVAVEKVFPVAKSSDPVLPSASWINTPTKAELMFPPIELHSMMAGTTVAIALVAIGLSFRKITATYDAPYEDASTTGRRFDDRKSPRTPPTPVAMARTFNPDIEVEVIPFVPAGRFWLLVMALALCTAAGGIFVTSRSADLFVQAQHQPKQFPILFWQLIKPEAGEHMNRRLAHAISGAAILITPLFLGALSRYAPRERLALLFFTMILIAAVAAQVWLGVLLMFDTSGGPINHFNPPTAATGVG